MLYFVVAMFYDVSLWRCIIEFIVDFVTLIFDFLLFFANSLYIA